MTELPGNEDSSTKIKSIFEAQMANRHKVGQSTSSERREKLKKLQKAILKYRKEIREACFKDQGKHPSEVDLTEIYPALSEIKHARRELSLWMQKHKVKTPISLLGASSYFKYEAKGCALIISPWNFPFNLTFSPLVSAIAAGNTVMVKPSENSSHASELIARIVKEIFDENEVSVLQGGVSVSTELLKLPFHHIFFTGSPAVGKVVMKAASENLTSVTLELGGKSPTIVDESANIDAAARRIVWGKFMNNGQTCIASDYIYVHEKVKDKFYDKLKHYILKLYSNDAASESSYGRIINKRHNERVSSYLEDARSKGAKVESVSGEKGENNFIPPTLVSNLGMDTELMKNEIFGPVLPIFHYSDIDRVIEQINSGEKPLASYIFSEKPKNVKYIISNTSTGGTVVNNVNIQFTNPNLPFGGVNNSGIGKGHGFFGFQEFSNARAVMKQNIAGLSELVMPPFNNFKQKLIDITLRWL